MNVAKIQDAADEARRFIRLAGAAIAKIKRDHATYNSSGKLPLETWTSPSKETGACRRASMDLTRALARLRSRS